MVRKKGQKYGNDMIWQNILRNMVKKEKKQKYGNNMAKYIEKYGKIWQKIW